MKKIILHVTAIFFSFSSCKESTTLSDSNSKDNFENLTFESPIKTLEIKPQIYRVNSNQESTISLKSGGSIIIPANCFVTLDGKPITGNVDIIWKEFHSLSDILVSGIPMTINSDTEKGNFVSGGMFTIAGSQNETPIKFADNKEAVVNLVSTQPDTNYNFYKFDNKAKDWVYQFNNTKIGARPFEGLDTRQENILTEQTKAPKSIEKKRQLLDVTIDVSKFPELANEEIVAWECLSPIKNKRSIAAQKIIPILSSHDSTKHEYKMTLKKGNYLEVLVIKPYTLADAKKNSVIEESKIEKLMKKRVEFQNNLEAGKIVRSIRVSDFGTYNCDRIYGMDNPIVLNVDFELKNDQDPELASIFLVSPDENLLIKYDIKNRHEFFFDPKKRQCLIAILPDNSVHFTKNEDFNEARKLKRNTPYTFKMNPLNTTLKKGQDLDSLINASI